MSDLDLLLIAEPDGHLKRNLSPLHTFLCHVACPVYFVKACLQRKCRWTECFGVLAIIQWGNDLTCSIFHFHFPSLNFTKFLVFYLGPHWIRVGDWKYLEKKTTIFSFKFPLSSLSGAQPYKNAFLSVCLKSEVELLDGVLATVVQSLTAGWTPHWLSDNGSASLRSLSDISITAPLPPEAPFIKPQCHAVCL